MLKKTKKTKQIKNKNFLLSNKLLQSAPRSSWEVIREMQMQLGLKHRLLSCQMMQRT